MSMMSPITTPTQRLLRTILFGVLAICMGSLPSAHAQQQKPVSREPIVGTLPNGLTYYIRYNSHPANRAMMWLAVNAGSIQEDDDQRGFAHFLEHMAFNGTRNFPENALIDEVERFGMRFGADLNAYTSFDETVYQLMVPTDNKTGMERALQMLHDWASGGILNDSMAIVEERGVVLGEWRTRLLDSFSQKFQKEQLERIFGKGSRYVERIPIGDPKLLENANPSAIKRFYNDWYVPNRMAVILVGDFDPEEMAAVVKAKFGAIPKPRSERKFERPKLPSSSKTVVRLLKPNVAPRLQFTWPIVKAPKDAKEAARLAFIERLTFQYLSKIAGVMTQTPNRLAGGIAIGRTKGISRAHGEQYQITLFAHPDTMMPAFRAILTEMERLAQHGIPAPALEAGKAALLRALERDASGNGTTVSRAYAAKYVDHFLGERGPVYGPAAALQYAKELLPTITARDIAAFAARWRNEQGREFSMNIHRITPLYYLTEPSVIALLDSVAKEPLVAQTPFLRDSGTAVHAKQDVKGAGSVQSIQSWSKINATEMTLSNGAKVVVVPTNNDPDEVLIVAGSQGGTSRLSDEAFNSTGRMAAFLVNGVANAWIASSDNDVATTTEKTGVREFNVQIDAFNETMTVRGSPKDLGTLFEFMHTQFTNPILDSALVEEWRKTGVRWVRASDNDLTAVKWGKSQRFAVGQPQWIMFIDVNEAMDVYRDRFGDASDFTFYIVGAVDTAVVRTLVERYIATLPSTQRVTRETPRNLGIRPPSGKLKSSGATPKLLPERSMMTLDFVGEVGGTSSIEQSVNRRKIQALTTILARRLRKRLREEMAITYSPSTSVKFYYTPDSRYVLSVSFVASPEMVDSGANAVWEEIRKLQAEGPTEQEIAITSEIMYRQRENAAHNNRWLAQTMMQYEWFGLPLDGWMTEKRFTPSEIREAANQYISDTVYAQTILKSDKLNTSDSKKEGSK
jgi:zinc protease